MLNWWSRSSTSISSRRRTRRDNVDSTRNILTDRVSAGGDGSDFRGDVGRTWKQKEEGLFGNKEDSRVQHQDVTRSRHHHLKRHAARHHATSSSGHHANNNNSMHHYQAGAALAAFLLAWIATFELVEAAARKDSQQEQPRISYGLQPFASPRDYVAEDPNAAHQGSTRRAGSSLDYAKGQERSSLRPGATEEVIGGATASGGPISTSTHRRDQSPNSVYSNQRLPKRQSNQWSGHTGAQSKPSSSFTNGGGGSMGHSGSAFLSSSNSDSFAAGSSSAAFSSLLNLHYEQPSFDPATPRNVTGQQGQTVYLHCVVRNLGDKTVSWIRRKDFHVLTVGLVTYTTDERFQAVHNEATQDWMLQIRLTTLGDAGSFECQVNSHPLISLFVNLTVLVPKANIQGSPDLYVKTGSAINLTCVIRDSPEPPVFIFWYHDDRMINYDSTRGEISILKAGDDTTLSRLFIPRVQPADTGNYTCGPSNADATRISVHVLNGEKPAAMQHDVSPSRAATTFRTSAKNHFLLWAYSIWCCSQVIIAILWNAKSQNLQS